MARIIDRSRHFKPVLTNCLVKFFEMSDNQQRRVLTENRIDLNGEPERPKSSLLTMAKTVLK